MRKHKVYTFEHKGQQVSFGPYLSGHEAMSAFQRWAGYWPDPAIQVQDYREAR